MRPGTFVLRCLEPCAQSLRHDVWSRGPLQSPARSVSIVAVQHERLQRIVVLLRNDSQVSCLYEWLYKIIHLNIIALPCHMCV